MSVWQQWKDTDRGKPKYVLKPLINASFSTDYPTLTDWVSKFNPPEDEGSMFLQQTTWCCNPQHYHMKWSEAVTGQLTVCKSIRNESKEFCSVNDETLCTVTTKN